MQESKSWILRAIEGSFTDFHIDGCRTLLKLFAQRYGHPNGGNEQYDSDLYELHHAINAKMYSLAQ